MPRPTPTATPQPAPTPLPTPTPNPTPPPLPEPPESRSITATSLQSPTGEPLVTPPDLNKLSFSDVGTDGNLTVTGQPGAVPGSYTVFVQSLQTGASIKTTSQNDGSFEASVPATQGSTIVVNYGDANAGDWMQGSPALEIAVGLGKPTSPSEVPFTAAGPDSAGTGHWRADGVQHGWSFLQGETIRYTIEFSYVSPNISADVDLDQLRIRRLYPSLNLSRISDAQGGVLQATFIPVLMTPTGEPIFSRGGYEHHAQPFTSTLQSVEISGNTLDMTMEFTQEIPAWLPSGHYVGRIDWQPRFIWPDNQPASPPTGAEEGLLLRTSTGQALLPALRIGPAAQPRLPWMLLANTLSNGSRGAVAREDKGAFALGNKISYNADRLIVPKNDPETGGPITYRLEPFLPTIGYHMGGPNRPVPPLVSFLLPSGELQVSVTAPDGTVKDLGRAPFRSGRAKSSGNPTRKFGSTSVHAFYELTTFDPAFEYQFQDYGHYVVNMRGWVQDATGITYAGGGSYDLYVAEPLDLDLGTFLNTPFEVGDVMSPVVHTRPGVPADVTVDFKLFPNSNPAKVIAKTLSGRANRYGYFHPGGDAEQLVLSAPGEYAVDVTASYTDQDGVLWMGAVKGASLVETPDTTLITRGKRGITAVGGQPGSTPQWFFMKNIDPPGLSGEEEGTVPQVFYPYNAGDVQWAADDTASGIFPMLTLHDPEKVTNLHLLPRNNGKDVIGEMDVEFPEITSMNLPAVQYPELIDTWAYYYTSVQRPGVTVRSFVGTGEVQRAYWQFGDAYNLQPGNGGLGDLPGDVKLQYGGIVYRDAPSGTNEYAIYASMAAMIAKGTELGQRVFPPFQGAAGGPSGGPLLTLKGEDIDIFFTPVGVMPGSVLETGDTFAFSGAMWPTLASLTEITVTTPSGETVSATGRANKIGYFYSPDDDFAVTEPGIYTVNVKVTHDGMTSAGPVQAPFPTGGVLGAAGGTYTFYVVPQGSDSYLTIDVARTGARLIAGNPLTITSQLPSGLTGVVAHHTVNFTGTVLESGPLPSEIGSFTYTYDLATLNQSFANLDLAPGDTVVVTLAVAGNNSSGQSTSYAVQVLLQGADIFALAEP